MMNRSTFTNQSTIFSPSKEIGGFPTTRLAMEVVTEYVSRKAELEEKIRALESEKASLIADIASLKEKITTFELEKAASALQSEVESLRTEKSILEEKAATYEAAAGYEIPQGVPE